ncbi:MAG: Lrp/AsnC ligand binding domain-containing protein [Rhodospirillales bacterium]|nr:Lrp/AsnC ligand binding domain-containing protein [Rhodospirillales bacterium]
MQTIFVQVKCELGRSYDVASAAIEDTDGISEVHSTSGDFDLMLTCYLDDETDIGRFVNENIQTIPGIRDTHTIIAFKAFG